MIVSRTMRAPSVIIALVLLVAAVGVFFLVRSTTVTGQVSTNAPVIVLPKQDSEKSILQQTQEAIDRQYKQCMSAIHDKTIENLIGCSKRCIELIGPQPDFESCRHQCINSFISEHDTGMHDCDVARYAPRIRVVHQPASPTSFKSIHTHPALT